MALIKDVEQKKTQSGKDYWRVNLAGIGWASTFDTKIGALCAAHRGSDIEVTTEKDSTGKYTNITSARAPAGGSSGSSRDVLIVKEVALKAAVERFAGNTTATDLEVITTAQVFSRWLLEPVVEDEPFDPDLPV